MAFGSSTNSYGNTRLKEAFDTPYAKAAQEWDRRMGQSVVQARGWRAVAIVSLLTASVMAVGLVIQSRNKQVVTYVVPINELGQPGKLTLASAAYQPTATQSGYFVAELVKLSRARSLDPVVTRDAMTKVYRFLAGDGIGQMNQFASNDPLLAEMGRGQRVARSVEVSSVLQKSATTFQVRWIETEFANGMQRSRDAFTGLFEIKLVPPKTESDAFNNPLGLFVTSFSWAREFTPVPAPTNTGVPTDAADRSQDRK